ncbi:kinesin motor protein cin8 [Rhizophlyctis rosea]|nr:kinesin motor protein cin8 [Rhizophlyctis rosea]
MNQNPQETNIAVVVRVRPRNAKEVRENSPIAVTTNGKKGKEVHIKTSAADLSSKTYTFDKVFGPDADQSLIFEDVVSPILEEVRMGYNCTIFAYGQTGTGKTYTMEGDLDAATGDHAGIIPRTLYSLFETLETETAGEYSVRVSYIELYNEELKDLLSPDDDFRKLKMYEDLNKKGSVVVQGMEEVLVNNAADVIAILQKGSNKRQIASTKMNETSSRSHGIFSITVHIKESTPEGEDLLKVGKLNLVDLAGSENIGRSGAKEKRAVEAGMINQSLLTLGRVINALVERSPHIPYRESKLTRILQDSLGGRTKTCIIAAVSPAKCNLEESLSTLDYAHRAKNIRNKPEINQRMTKKALIKEYISEIERLKAELAVQRDKNGIFLSPETFDRLNNENQSGKDRQDELAKEVVAKEEFIKTLDAKFQSNVELLRNTNDKLDVTMSELEEKKKEFETTMEELRTTQQRLVEQTVLTEAHASTEKQLHAVAGGLVSTLRSSVSDVDGLHEKLDRKSAVEVENMEIFRQFQALLLQAMSTLESQISTFGSSTHTMLTTLTREMTSISEQHSREKTALQSNLEMQLQAFVDRSSQFLQKMQQQDAALTKELEGTAVLGRNMKATFHQKSDEAQEIHSRLFATLKNMITDYQTQIGEFNSSTKSDLSRMFESVKAHVGEQMLLQQRSQKTMEESLHAEIAALRLQNQELTAALARQRQSAAQSRTNLMADIGRLFSTYTEEQDMAIDKVVDATRSRTESRIEAIHKAIQEHRTVIEDAAIMETRFVDQLTTTSGRMLGDLDSGAKRMGDTILGMEQHCGNLEQYVAAFTAYGRHAVGESASQIEERTQQAERAGDLTAFHQSTSDALSEGKDRHCKQLEESCVTLSGWGETTTKQIAAVELFHRDASEQLGQTRNDINCKRLAEDQPTGQTPRKKRYKFPTTWRTTPHPEEVLREYRERGPSTSRRWQPDDPANPFASSTPSIPRSESVSSLETAVASDKENDGSGDRVMRDVDDTPQPGTGGGGAGVSMAFPAGSKLPRTRSRHFTSRRGVDSPVPGRTADG